MGSNKTPPGVQCRLYVRSLVPRQARTRQSAIHQRLEVLHQQGAIDDYDLTVCGRQIPPSPAAARTAVGESLATDVELFQEWARRNECALTLRDRTVDDRLTDEHYQAIEWPQMVLAEYHGQNLVVVAPADTGETVMEIEDRLDSLEAGETTLPFTPVERARTPTEDPTPNPP